MRGTGCGGPRGCQEGPSRHERTCKAGLCSSRGPVLPGLLYALLESGEAREVRAKTSTCRQSPGSHSKELRLLPWSSWGHCARVPTGGPGRPLGPGGPWRKRRTVRPWSKAFHLSHPRPPRDPGTVVPPAQRGTDVMTEVQRERTRLRTSVVMGRGTQSTHPALLPQTSPHTPAHSPSDLAIPGRGQKHRETVRGSG